MQKVHYRFHDLFKIKSFCSMLKPSFKFQVVIESCSDIKEIQRVPFIISGLFKIKRVSIQCPYPHSNSRLWFNHVTVLKSTKGLSFPFNFNDLVQNNGTDLCCTSSKFIIGFEDAVTKFYDAKVLLIDLPILWIINAFPCVWAQN